MANFDNGLPVEGTDISGCGANIALIVAKKLLESEDGQGTNVLVATGELLESEGGRITDVLISKVETGQNFTTML